ncbi:hypothetical protein ACFL27_10700 [candidate division CSSED10-310 bacterium]|uniref:DAGKc domain-containing protein n=1 Tax=candidate division CSSED10-310 bacterium TaxID=2855610 RepID=A0ABV6YWV3_UNCC1
MKKVWISALPHDEKLMPKILGLLRKYGLDVNGHFWTDDIKKMAWTASLEEMLKHEPDLWIIVGSDQELGTDTIRYGLSLLALAVQANKGPDFPIMILNSGQKLEPEILTTPLRNAMIIDVDNPALGAKVVAQVNIPRKKSTPEFRLDIHAHQSLGLWFELGPGEQDWDGILFGTFKGEIDAHGVGEAGKLPRTAVLEYQMKGIKLQSGDKEYIAWAVRNKLTPDLSYYVRVRDMAQSILFGPFSADDELDVHKMELF